jgi:ferredoxin-NADP reductase
VVLELRSPTGARLPSWHPGAHIDLLLPGGLIRQYSLCGDPGDHGAYTIAVPREDNGRGGSLLAAGVDVQYFGWCRLARCCDSAHRIPAVTCNDLPL